MRPCSLDELLDDDHDARLVWRLVQTWDLARFLDTIRARGEAPGRAATDPKLLVALWLYAATQGVAGGRELARLCEVERPLPLALRHGAGQLSHAQRLPGRPRGGAEGPPDPDARGADPRRARDGRPDRPGRHPGPRRRRGQQLQAARDHRAVVAAGAGPPGDHRAAGETGRGRDRATPGRRGAGGAAEGRPHESGPGGIGEGRAGQGPAEEEADQVEPGACEHDRPRVAVPADARRRQPPGVQRATGRGHREPRDRRGRRDQRGERRRVGRADAGAGRGADRSGP